MDQDTLFKYYCWVKADLSYQMREGQKILLAAWEASKPKSRKFVIDCNRRFGKSTWGLEVLEEAALKKPNFHGLFCAPVKDSLREYVTPLIVKVNEDSPEDLRPELDSHLILHFHNGSSITFRGSNAQSYQNLRGNDFDLVFVDEFRNLDDGEDLLKSVLLPTIFNSKGYIIIASTQPDTEEHYLNELNQEAQKGGYYFHCDINDCARWDAEVFNPNQIEEWRKETNSETIWTREFLSKFVRDPHKTVIPEWDDKFIQFAPRDEYFQWYHKYVGLDTGVRDKTAGLFGYYDFLRAKLFIESEFAVSGSEVRSDKIADFVRTNEKELSYQSLHDSKTDEYKRLENHLKTFRRIADNNNLILINDLNSLHDLNFIATRKDELQAMINLVREWVSKGRIVISPECRELRGCLQNAIWDEHKKELGRSKVYGHFDALMALVYLVRNVDTSSNPIPKNFGKTFVTHALPVKAYEPQTASFQLGRMLQPKFVGDQARESFVRGHI